MSLVIGPSEVSVFLASALSRLHPTSEICVVCFNADTKHSMPTALKVCVIFTGFLLTSPQLPSDMTCLTRKLNTNPPQFLLMADAQFAGSRVTEELLKMVPPSCRLVMIGDDLGLATPLQRPEFGKPFLAMAESQTRYFLCRFLSLGKHTAKDCHPKHTWEVR